MGGGARPPRHALGALPKGYDAGDVRRLATTFYQPLGPGSPWFVEPAFQTVKLDADVYEGFRRTDRALAVLPGVIDRLRAVLPVG